MEESFNAAKGIGQHGNASAVAFYEKALQIYPGHIGAHHYLVHTFENIAQFDKALYYGKLYASQVPNVPHAQHMYGHDLMKMGKIDDAIVYFSKADSLERVYFKTEYIPSDYDWHHGHNLSLMAMCYQYNGEIQKAENCFKEVITTRPYALWNRFYYQKDYPEFLVNTGKTIEALIHCEKLINATTAGERVLGHVYKGRALVDQNKIIEAGNALDLAKKEFLNAEKEMIEAPGVAAFYFNPVMEQLESLIKLNTLEKKQEGISQLRKYQKHLLEATGPDEWIEAIFRFESIVKAAYKSGDKDFTLESAKVLHMHDPAYPGSAFALANASELNGEDKKAKIFYSEAVKRWKKADKNYMYVFTAQKKIK